AARGCARGGRAGAPEGGGSDRRAARGPAAGAHRRAGRRHGDRAGRAAGAAPDRLAHPAEAAARAGRRRGGRHVLSRRRMGAAGPARGRAAAAGPDAGALLRARSGARVDRHRPAGDDPLRRLRRADRRAHRLHRDAGRVHAAGHLLELAARAARVHGGGTARSEGRCAIEAGRAGRRAACRDRRCVMSDDTLAIDVRGLTKRYGTRTVVDHVALRVRTGRICGFLGPNGSGKTTTIRMLCGLLRPDAGEGTCLGLDIIDDAYEIRRQVGYMTQKFGLYDDLSIRQNLDFVARLFELPQRAGAVDRALARLGLVERQHQLAGALSGGWKQRLALAACLIHEPRLLLLDEPTAGVDPKARRDFWDEIHRLAAQGITVLVSTHYMDEAERCHELVYIAYGKALARGTERQIIEQAGLVVWAVEGDEAPALVEPLKTLPAVLSVAAFGNALNTDPKGLPTAIVSYDSGPMARSLAAALQNTGYFHITHQSASERDAEALIEAGTVQFMVAIPPDFSRRVVRGERPAILVAVDATDPSASGNAIAALAQVAQQALRADLVGPLASLQPGAAPYEVRVHRRYNPEGLSRYNIVPGLIGTILTMTMVMLTGLAMTRERERGTMENLLATPVRPMEVMLGK